MAEQTQRLTIRVSAVDTTEGVLSRVRRRLEELRSEAARPVPFELVTNGRVGRFQGSPLRFMDEQAERDAKALGLRMQRELASLDADGRIAGVARAVGNRAGRGFAAGFAERLRDLKSLFGRRGPVGEIFETIFLGGGAIGAIGLITGSLAKAAENAAKVAGEFRNGQIGASGLVDGIARGIPILGDLYSMTASFVDLLSGATAEWEEMRKRAEATAGAWAKINQIAGGGSAVASIGAAAALAGQSPEEQERIAARQRAESRADELGREANEQTKLLNEVWFNPKVNQRAKEEAVKEFTKQLRAREEARRQIDRILEADLAEIEKKYAKERAEAADEAMRDAVAGGEFSIREFMRMFVSGTQIEPRDFAAERAAAMRNALLEAHNAAFRNFGFAQGLIPTPEFAASLLPGPRFAGGGDERFTTGVGESQRDRLQAEVAKTNKEIKDEQKKTRELFEKNVVPQLAQVLQFILNPGEVLPP